LKIKFHIAWQIGVGMCNNLMFSIPKCSTRIYNKQRCPVKHNIHIINIFIDLWLHVSIH